LLVESAPLLEARRISKRFASVQALHDVSLCLGHGEVLAVIGENGAGKSTLMKILAGVQSPDAGELWVDGRATRFDNVQHALRAGVALIHQELNLAGNLDVGANIFLGREPLRWGMIDRRSMEHQARHYLELIGLDVSPRRRVDKLSIGRQQLVEIAKAISTHARVLIMDEPTSSLSQHETEILFQVVRDLRARGVSILYISHRLGEVSELADRVLVLRDGRQVGELARDQIDRAAMVQLMVGRDVSQFYHRTPHAVGDAILKVDALRTPAHPQRPIRLSLADGEIVGIAGLVGAGRTELLTTLFGISPALGGTLSLGSLDRPPRSPREAIDAGMILVPEDRRQSGLMLSASVKHNLSLASLRRRQRLGMVNRRAESELLRSMSQLLRIKVANPAQPARYLSGGNQQKVVLGKWLALKPRVLLLDEPTRGIDVGAKEEIYKLMHDLAGQGMAILFASSEMEEILGLSDRALVMRDGALAGELPRDQFSEQAIMRLATGEGSTHS
jgi:ribose transport system ATP-binding protein